MNTLASAQALLIMICGFIVIICIPACLIMWIIRFNSKRNEARLNQKVSISSELEKLYNLKEKGIITPEEFENTKSNLLKL